MDTELLKTFLEVHRTRHFGKAAENLYLTPSAVTARIQQLESLLATPLFIRSRNNLQLTEAGNQLIPHAQTMLNSWQQARQELSRSGSFNVLTVAVTPSLWEILVRPRLPHIGQLPSEQLGLRCSTLPSHTISQQLAQGRLDLALLHDPLPLADFEMVGLGDITLRLYGADSSQTAAQAIDTGFVQVEWGDRFMRQFQQLYASSPLPRLVLEPSSTAAEWIAVCGGSAYLPELVAEPYLKQGQLFAIADGAPIKLKSFALFRGESPQRPQIERLLEALGKTPV